MRRFTVKFMRGFTLIESLISIVILMLISSIAAALYYSGLQALDAQSEHVELDSHLRSRMERLLSTKFDQLASSSEVVTVDGRNHTVAWTVVAIDLDGDMSPESNANLITVSIDNLSTLTTIFVDHQGKIGKL